MPEKTHHFSKLAEELIGDFRNAPPSEPRRQVKRPTQAFAKVVEDLMVKHHIGRPSAAQTIRDHWVEIVGAPNAGYSHVMEFEGKILTVLVSHAVVRSELLHHREEIIRRVRELPGCETLKSLNLRAG